MSKQDHYEKLKRVEKKRRRILLQVGDRHWRTLFRWNGTFCRHVFTDPILWINTAVLLTLRFHLMQDENFTNRLKQVMESYKHEIHSIAATLGFFLVFFIMENNTRFTETYEHAMEAKGNILAIASMAKSKLKRDQGLKIVRLINAAYAAGFVGLSDAYTYDGCFLELNKSLMLLTEEELQRVVECKMDEGGSCYREILQWVQIEVENLREDQQVDETTASVLAERVINIQSSISQLYNFCDQPLIFFYIHLLYIVTIIYLPMFNLYACAIFSLEKGIVNYAVEIVQVCVIWLHHVFYTGMRELGKTLSDPFGMDYEDLSVMHYINFTWRESGRIMQAENPLKTTSITSEESLVIERKASIGEAWSPK